MVIEPSELVTAEPSGFQLSAVVMQPFPQMEAAVVNELDRVTALADSDPLAALDQTLRLMQGLDVEILKCMAPSLLERAQHDATTLATGKLTEPGKPTGRQMASMLRLQESIAKLGLARVRIRDEQERRSPRPVMIEA